MSQMPTAKTMTGQEIAKAIRADFKAAVKGGALPKASYFVRQTWSGYTPSITVTVKGWTGEMFNAAWIDHVARTNEYPRYAHGVDRFSVEANALLDAATRLASAYNFNESRIEEDYHHVGYFLSVEFSGQREAQSAAIAERRSGSAAA